MFSKLLYIINLSSYITEQLKFHHFSRGGGGGGGKNSPLKSPTFSCNGRNQYFYGKILAKCTTKSIRPFIKNVHTNIINKLSIYILIFFCGGMVENNHAMSSINNQYHYFTRKSIFLK